MRFLNLLVCLVVVFAVGYTGFNLFIMEKELYELRQARIYNSKIAQANNVAQNAIDFAHDTQKITTRADDRAFELSNKLNVASDYIVSLEEQLENANFVVEQQSEELQELIEDNSKLQIENEKLFEENAELTINIIDLENKLEKTKKALDEATQIIQSLESVIPSDSIILPDDVYFPIFPD